MTDDPTNVFDQAEVPGELEEAEAFGITADPEADRSDLPGAPEPSEEPEVIGVGGEAVTPEREQVEASTAGEFTGSPDDAVGATTPESHDADEMTVSSDIEETGAPVASDKPVSNAASQDAQDAGGGPKPGAPMGASDEPATEPMVDTDAEVLQEDDIIATPPAREKSPYDRPGKWYVLHTQSGYEKKVKEKIEARAKSLNMEGKIYEIAIPMEEVTEVKANRKVVSKKKLFPGYLLIRCRLDDDSWYAIRNTEGVTGFVGAGNKPTPLTRRDVEGFISVDEGTAEEAPKRAKPRLEYELHETVQVKDGPFADFSGEIVEINEDHLKMKVLVNIFGRETPVELEFSQVGKL